MAKLVKSSGSSNENNQFPLIQIEESENEKNGVSYVEYDAAPFVWHAPSGYENHCYTPHIGENSQYLRDILLGFADGMLSNLLLMVGMYASHADSLSILLTGLGGCLGGTLSMALGEFIATRNQRLVADGEMKLEQQHMLYHRDVEIEQARRYLQSVGIEGPLCEAVLHEIGDNDESMLMLMSKFEFGISDDDLQRNPVMAGSMSGGLFFIGSLPPILPFIWTNTTDAFIIAVVISALFNFMLGSLKTVMTKGNWLHGGIEQLGMAIVGGSISYGVGAAFQAVLKTVDPGAVQSVRF